MTDHLLTPPDPLYPAIHVPCLGDEPYDELDFHTYPTRRGWDVELLMSGNFDQHPPNETVAFLQDWLYFGVLFEVLGIIKSEYTAKPSESGRVRVSTKRLRQDLLSKLSFVNDRLRDGPNRDPKPVWDWLNRSEACLEILGHFCNITSIPLNSKGMTWPLPPGVDLSIRILGRALTSLCLSIFGNIQETVLFQTYFQGSPFCVSRMVEQNWCPSEISRALDQFSSSTLYYVSQMRRPTVGRDHARCTTTKCHAFYTDHRTYQTKHVKDGCGCSHVVPDIVEIVRVILAGRIPLLAISQDNTESLNVRVEAFSPGMRFVAVSHVWADGLGNAEDNSLPECQILNLATILNELKSRNGQAQKSQNEATYFWIDTICVPLGKISRAARECAVDMMKDTYASADQVIVLDAELMATEHKDMLGTFMRVSLSGWMRRLWTLHEAVLAEHVLVKFKNEIINIQEGYDLLDPRDKAWRESQERRIDTGFGTLVADAKQFYWRMRGLRMDLFASTESTPNWTSYADEMRRCQNVIQAFEACRFRTTSRREDVYICMANLLGSEVDLWTVPVDRRMQLILGSRSTLPQGMLFVPGPRMREPGWQWAVSDFDYEGQSLMNAWIQDFTPAVRDEKGLTVEYPGLVLKEVQEDMTEDFVIGAYSEGSKNKRLWWRITLLPIDVVTEKGSTNTDGTQQATQSDKRHCLIYYPKAGDEIFKNIPMAAVLVSPGDATSAEILDASRPLACRFIRLAVAYLVGDDSDLLRLLRRPDLNVRFCTDYTAGRVMRKWTVG